MDSKTIRFWWYPHKAGYLPESHPISNAPYVDVVPAEDYVQLKDRMESIAKTLESYAGDEVASGRKLQRYARELRGEGLGIP